jgi:glutamate synthase (NADPH/NADH) large chain
MTGGTVFVLGSDLIARPHEAMTTMNASDPDAGVLRDLLERHHAATNSALARELIASWPQSAEKFLKYAPAVETPVPVAAKSR